ncbi:heterokaryon incompatibility protein-domain-containing protein [Apodospora peruviana]|uniref:Heterokaryon incompatibility protein-domain-containing protein n=1 Tax=Apodospora peruviana TaxID=516989 RepID=A0AAE0M4W8_9PEZI|nr:heterokaryon incompatibility protein-domain-containing protein [Apodospora peruviana]
MDWHDKSCRHLDEVRVGGLLRYPTYERHGGHGAVQTTSGPSRQLRRPVHCDIFVASVGALSYEAISYTWADESGDSSKPCSIFLDSVSFPVTYNCEMALRRVRLKASIRHIWIDAVCIDQANDDERGHQVRLMPQIFSRAKIVLVYIGEATKHSSSVLKSLATGCNDQLEFRLRDELTGLFSRRFFSRALLICGGTTVPWQLLTASHLLSSMRSDTPAMPPVVHFDRRVYTQPNQFLQLLVFASGCQAQDPRDLVYAILGLVPLSLSRKLEADYTLTVGRVYIRTACCLGRHFGWHSVFKQALAQPSTMPNLPSWAPDWSVPSCFKGPTPSF